MRRFCVSKRMIGRKPTLSLESAPSKTWLIGEAIRITEGIASEYIFPPEFEFRDFMIVYLKRGSLSGKQNGVVTHYEAPSLIMIQPGNSYEFTSASKGVEATTVSFSPSFTERLNLIKRFGLNDIFISNPSLVLDGEMVEQLEHYINQLMLLGRNPKNPFLEEALLHLTLCVFYSVGYHVYQIEQVSRSQQIVDEYLQLVTIHGTTEHYIPFYADKLHLSPKYLQNVVKKVTGRTAYSWLEDVITNYAKQLLTENKMTVQQISMYLNFRNQSYFTAFFKRVTSLTPSEYRLQHKS